VSKAFPSQKDNEQAAVIIQRPDGSYGYSTVAPQNDHDNFALRALLAKDHKLAGIVHSHPGADAYGQVFSPKDLDVSENLKVPSFIRFNSDSSIRKYVPGTTKTQRTQVSGNKFGLKTAVGDAIAQEQAEPATAAVVQRDSAVTAY
jgi:proteasome lid subunit RPN8/RPN11